MIIWNAAHYNQDACREAVLSRALGLAYAPVPDVPEAWRTLLQTLERTPRRATEAPAPIVRKLAADSDAAFFAADALLYAKRFRFEGGLYRVIRAYPLIERDETWLMVTLVEAPAWD